MSETYPTLDPTAILIERETRQRQENIKDIEDLKLSIAQRGIIEPLVVRRKGGKTILVAGERRLQSALELQLPSVPVLYMDQLSPEEAEIVELEENIKRKELHWKDHVRAAARIHKIYKQRHHGKWTVEQTAQHMSVAASYLKRMLRVAEALPSGRVDKADGIDQADLMLTRYAERRAEAIVSDLIVKGHSTFSATPLQAPEPEGYTTVHATNIVDDQAPKGPSGPSGPSGVPTNGQVSPPPYVEPLEPIICANFLEWAKTYSGRKFSLIHCDFPYGNYRGGDSQSSTLALGQNEFYDNTESVYWTLLDGLIENLDNIMSYSAHLLFWFNMNFYTETVRRFRKVGLMVHDHPFVWHKTQGGGGVGVAPGTATTYPRRTYDTALICVRGNRPLAKPGHNSYPAPTVDKKIHPSQKSEPMLRFFLQMFVDETTRMLDPTCGSGAALRAAEDLGANYILGLELDKTYADLALARTKQVRILRQAHSKVAASTVAAAE
jgi:ParB/RepB/Spo0J family partition protein